MATLSTARRPFFLALRRRLGLFLAIIGPGIITATSNNDAGGITTYSIAGAHYGYSLLWALLLATISLAVTQEIGARTGAVTGKGLAALIRENYGVRVTCFAMLALLIANQATTISEFAGVAASLEIFGVPRFLGVPVVAALVWYIVIHGNYKNVERVFLGFSLVYLSYVITGLLVGPPWGEVLRQTVIPSFSLDAGYLLTFVALVGTTITPWGQFFVQAYVVDKGITTKEYPYTRLDVLIGSFLTDFISFFIIVATAATLFANGWHIEDARDAALALEPLAGPLAQYLFALGLLNASMLAASIVPLATAYAITEAFGWEAGVDRSFKEAPAFNGIYTFTLVLAALVVLIPGLPLVTVMLVAQTVNGILLPVVLVLAARLADDPELMGKHANGPFLRLLVWLTVAAVVALTVLLLVATLVPPLFGISLT
ncbi:MAG TPA: divalent metal cation transporter [Chloroflexota bacterium]|nr:divalent metal cation transporter [Chloroflexota bacterium]